MVWLSELPEDSGLMDFYLKNFRSFRCIFCWNILLEDSQLRMEIFNESKRILKNYSMDKRIKRTEILFRKSPTLNADLDFSMQADLLGVWSAIMRIQFKKKKIKKYNGECEDPELVLALETEEMDRSNFNKSFCWCYEKDLQNWLKRKKEKAITKRRKIFRGDI